MSKYHGLNNTKLLTKSFATDSRQQRRKRKLTENMARLKRQFAGNTSSGASVWPENMSRRQRRAIVRDMEPKR